MPLQETDDTDSCLDDSQEAYEGNKDAARAILRVKQKLDGYEDGEMRSVQGQVSNPLGDANTWKQNCVKIFVLYPCKSLFLCLPLGPTTHTGCSRC